ncbi:hypothetical protein D6D15_09933 [Aureobasidium pullulans]|uniref:Uncharacterized protein n=1 Tax=Aureobasidium pullulans TaxID=5580 RepID=A0A4S9ASA8_AURPU|nr:hypothetical protein D6D15_09933 [Aureobasidium pullulans]
MELLRQELEQASKAAEELKKDITAFKAQISKKNKEDAERKTTALENKTTALEAHTEKQDKMIIALLNLARTVVEKSRDVESLASRLRELSDIINIITTTTTIAKLINMEYMEVFEKICSELEAARKEITRLDLENQAKQTKIHELSAESTRNMNMWQFQKNLVHEFVKEAGIIELKETVSKQEIRELENDLIVKNEELRLIRGREIEGVQKIKELEQVVKSLEMQNSRLEEDIEAQSCHTE